MEGYNIVDNFNEGKINLYFKGNIIPGVYLKYNIKIINIVGIDFLKKYINRNCIKVYTILDLENGPDRRDYERIGGVGKLLISTLKAQLNDFDVIKVINGAFYYDDLNFIPLHDYYKKQGFLKLDILDYFIKNFNTINLSEENKKKIIIKIKSLT